jgi:hypothetical protein
MFLGVFINGTLVSVGALLIAAGRAMIAIPFLLLGGFNLYRIYCDGKGR